MADLALALADIAVLTMADSAKTAKSNYDLPICWHGGAGVAVQRSNSARVPAWPTSCLCWHYGPLICRYDLKPAQP